MRRGIGTGRTRSPAAKYPHSKRLRVDVHLAMIFIPNHRWNYECRRFLSLPTGNVMAEEKNI